MTPTTITIKELQAHLDRLDDGVLKSGSHKPGREFCALEFKSQIDGVVWTDNPSILNFPDIRPLNDARWSLDKIRTKHMLPLMAALWPWSSWTKREKNKCVVQVVVATVQQIISELPGLPKRTVAQCRAVNTIDAARYAAADAAAAIASYAAAIASYAAAAADAAVAADAAAAAAAAAAVASYTADAAAAVASYDAAAADAILIKACQIWIEAAKNI